MLKLKKVVIVNLIIFTTLVGCAWFEQSEHEKIVGDYEVGWNDLVRNRSISKSIRDCSGCSIVLVPDYVYAVGHNDSFIIAKTFFAGDTTRTYYYIIDRKVNEKYGYSKGVYESLNESAFDSLRSRLKIADIPFDMNYPKKP